MKRAVNCDNVALSEHVLEILKSAATNFLLGLSGKGLIVKVKEFFAVEGYETSQDAFTNAADTDSSDHFAFDIEGVLGNGGDIPISMGDLFVGGDKVTDESKNGEDDCSPTSGCTGQSTVGCTMFSYGDNVGAGDFSN